MKTTHLVVAGVLFGLGGCQDGGLPTSTPSPKSSARVSSPDFNADSPTSRGLRTTASARAFLPAAAGDEITSWAPAGFDNPWGVGYDGNVWLSDAQSNGNNGNHEFTVEGVPTGSNNDADWAGNWPADMAAMGEEMCQVNVGGDNGIYCWDKGTGEVTQSITEDFGAGSWTSTSQRGLAYRSDDDTFYIGGWNQAVLWQVRGFSHAAPGEVVSRCDLSGVHISGLAWNPTVGDVWIGVNSTTDDIFRVNPNTCDVVRTLAHPDPGFNQGGMSMDMAGNLWVVSQDGNRAYLIETGVPGPGSIAELSETVSSLDLHGGIANSLLAKLNAALAALADDDIEGVCSALQAFINQVNAQAGKKISQDEASLLIDEATAIREGIGC